MNIKGSIHTFTQNNQSEHKIENGIALVTLNRAYFKFHTRTNIVTGLGQIRGKKIIFNLGTANIDAADADKYNSNALFEDGNATALPPVVITHPFGVEHNWIIQDTEGMVDLTFTPLSVQKRTVNVIIMKSTETIVYGSFEGVLLNKDSERIMLKNFPGFINANRVRT